MRLFTDHKQEEVDKTALDIYINIQQFDQILNMTGGVVTRSAQLKGDELQEAILHLYGLHIKYKYHNYVNWAGQKMFLGALFPMLIIMLENEVEMKTTYKLSKLDGILRSKPQSTKQERENIEDNRNKTSTEKSINTTQTAPFESLSSNVIKNEKAIIFSDRVPRIKAFSSNKVGFTNGEKVTLYWETSNADKVEISDIGVVESKGLKTVNVEKTDTTILSYTLKAWNASSCQTVLKILEIPHRGSTQYNLMKIKKAFSALFYPILMILVFTPIVFGGFYFSIVAFNWDEDRFRFL